jgi:hypothetical protein
VTSTVAAIFSSAGLESAGTVGWRTLPSSIGPGVYVVSLANDAHALGPTLPDCPIDPVAIRELLARQPELRVDGRPATAQTLAARIARFWFPDEVVLYVGLAGTSVRKRVGEYYRTPLGARKPHAGGWFLKVLSVLDTLTVHFAPCEATRTSESRMIESFCEGVSEETLGGLFDPAHPLPFAKLEWPPGIRKSHGITGAKGDAPAKGPPVLLTRSRATRMDVDAINEHVQQQLRSRGLQTATPVQAATWLDEAGLLTDSKHRPGKPLRDLLRAGRIVGQRQESNHRWFIDRDEQQ